MNDRVNPFASISEDPPVFTTKPRAEKRVEDTTIAELAQRNNFPSRQAANRRRRSAASRASIARVETFSLMQR